VAEDRAPNFVIHSSYQMIVDKALHVIYEIVHFSSMAQFEERINELVHDPNNMKRKLFDVLFQNESDTVGQASAIIQLMLYICGDADLWIPYFLELEGEEIILMLRRVLDALLTIIFGKDKIPMASKYCNYCSS
jgi:hypothetical protein